MERLLLLRHAKSDRAGWRGDDRSRPLNARGRRDAPRMGRWMAAQGLRPDWIVASPARRVEETVRAVLAELGIDPATVVWEPAAYLAPGSALLALLAAVPGEARTVLLAGHNPGLEELLRGLAPEEAAALPGDKLLPTCTLAVLAPAPSPPGTPPRRARLLRRVRPRDLPETLP
ncbi:SixA phosphatase family protein [Inmirania thermothiophila]|uniref:Phosphohistidine phosphatase n=1 Tax=Inmirania thermothiophila TaxID=1750597 RepID=A0A3N1YB19_9GAMM|nr:histidine phosphatase family protein [Inmirania thermothiophila]ROR34587.1 phosphohistidine phosphatase [Inmirania thermothiophila]